MKHQRPYSFLFLILISYFPPPHLISFCVPFICISRPILLEYMRHDSLWCSAHVLFCLWMQWTTRERWREMNTKMKIKRGSLAASRDISRWTRTLCVSIWSVCRCEGVLELLTQTMVLSLLFLPQLHISVKNVKKITSYWKNTLNIQYCICVCTYCYRCGCTCCFPVGDLSADSENGAARTP